ncbi:MAG: transposase [Phycisphaerae bacterium]
MARKPRYCPGGYVYHVLNRSAGRTTLFRQEEDYAAFESVMLDAFERVPLRIISWCLMKNHWCFVVWPRTDDEVTGYFRALAHTHAMRWRVAHRSVGWGHLYQGRFKAFPVESGSHVLTVCRHVERKALSAGKVKQAEQWRWGSLWLRHNSALDDHTRAMRRMLSAGPMGRWPNLKQWTQTVNAAPTKGERNRLEVSVKRSQPFGAEPWTNKTVVELGLEHTIRPEGRPKQPRNGSRT